MYYKQKEFCRLTGLTRKSLNLYEEKELLVPAKVDTQNSYRYYSLENLLKGSMISFLRSLEFSVEEMRMTLSGTNTYELFSRKLLRLRELYQKAVHGLDFMEMSTSYDQNFEYRLSSRIFHPGTVLSMSGTGSAKDIKLHLSVLRNFITQNNIYCNGHSFTYYYANSRKEKLHFKICQPVHKQIVPVQNKNITCEYFKPVKIAYITHYGSYELLPQLYPILKKKLLLSQYDYSEEYIEIYKNHSISANIKDTTTFVTDLGAIICQ